MHRLFLTKLFLILSLFFISIAIIFDNIFTTEIIESKEILEIKTGYESADIPAINNPRFTNVFLADNFLFDSEMGVHVNIDGVDKFYSNQILNWHHVVNESIGERFLIISRCPLCNSNSVYLSDNPLNSGLEVINNNNMLWDNFGNRWRQIDGRALGDHEDLEKVPSFDISWRYWKLNYRNGEVLTMNTGFDRNYNQPPFQGYSINEYIFYPTNKNDIDNGVKSEIIEVYLDGDKVKFASDLILNNIFLDKQNSILISYIPNISSFKVFFIEGNLDDMNFIVRNNLIVETNSGSIFDPMLSSQIENGIRLNSLLFDSYYKFCAL